MFCEWSFIGTQPRPFIVCCLRLLPTSLSGCDQDRLALRDCSCLVSNRESLGAPGLGRSRGPALLFLLVVICLGVWSLYSVKFLLSGPVTLPCMYKIPSPFGFPSHLGRGFPRGSDSEQSAIQETQKDPLPEGMATHSSILAWRIPQREEPGGAPGGVHGVAKSRPQLSN